MSSYWKVSLWGLSISALGTLPLGTLNVAAMQVSVSEGLTSAIYFSLGVALVEVMYVRISLVGLHWIRQNARLLKWMDWIALAVVLALAAGSFYAASQPDQHKSIILQTKLPSFFLGMLMSAINPAQVPFWFGWSSVLFSKRVLHANASCYNYYIIGIGFGTLVGLSIFAFGGRFLVNSLQNSHDTINYIIGSVFLLTAIIQLVKILMHKGIAESTEQKAIELEEVEAEVEAEDEAELKSSMS
jgi:threonine/homoserine/homoserine lactone efflux protein